MSGIIKIKVHQVKKSKNGNARKGKKNSPDRSFGDMRDATLHYIPTPINKKWWQK